MSVPSEALSHFRMVMTFRWGREFCDGDGLRRMKRCSGWKTEFISLLRQVQFLIDIFMDVLLVFFPFYFLCLLFVLHFLVLSRASRYPASQFWAG